ncbi:MAG: heme-copper oxidase subunit III [Halioglobus sp.]
MSFFKTLGEKPWLAQAAGGVPLMEHDPHASGRIALRFFLAVVGVLFFLFTITFLSRSQYPDFQALAGQPWQPFTDPTRLWFNTALLAFSSLAMHMALMSSRAGRMNSTIIGVTAAAFFAVLFLLAQLDLWQELQAMGFGLGGNPANSYFYLLTAVHGLHIAGGLIALSNVVFRVWNNGELSALSGLLKLCANYWHFLFIIWLLLFGLLTSEPDTINALAALCGF